jgi:hypothetical protein
MANANTNAKKLDNLDAGSFTAVNESDVKLVKEGGKPLTKKEQLDALKAQRRKKILGDNPEEFKHEGKLVYARNPKTKEIMFFNEHGEEESFDVVDRLEGAYPTPPETGDFGGAKKGDLKVRFTKEVLVDNKNGPGKVLETQDVSEAECEMISERQDYEDGTVWTKTIPKRHHKLVKLLRGEIGQEEVKEE